MSQDTPVSIIVFDVNETLLDITTIEPLFPLPFRHVFLREKGVNACLGILGQHIAGHRLCCHLVGCIFRGLKLLVEQFLTKSDGDCRLGGDFSCHFPYGFIQLIRRYHLVDKAELESGRRIDEITGNEHLERLFLRHVTGQGNHGG